MGMQLPDPYKYEPQPHDFDWGDLPCTDILLPEKIVELMSDEWFIRAVHGGRGSGKTRSLALLTAIKGYFFGQMGRTGQILCGREHLNSLAESSMEEIKLAITEELLDEYGQSTGEYRYPWLVDYWEIGQNYIRSRDGRISYVFAGLRENLNSIKSKARLLLAWIDEAETVPESSWLILIPTLREANSELWVSWNPEQKDSATDKRFRQNPDESTKVVEMNWRDNPWFPENLERQRLNDMKHRPEVYDHVWEGDYYFFAEGAYYLSEMRAMAEDGRMLRIHPEPDVPVWTAWDLGMGDSTAIWAFQVIGSEVRILRYYEASGESLQHYVGVLEGWASKTAKDSPGFTYGGHILPHDVQVRELGTGKSRLETLKALGLTNIKIAAQLGIDDGIQAVRSIMPRVWIDVKHCDHGIQCLRQYRREYNEKMQVWKTRPLHDWTSHAADAFRYLAIAISKVKKKSRGGPLKRNIKGIA